MAQRRSLAWTELKVGLLVIVSFAALSIVIVKIGGQTSIFAKYIDVTAYFPDANGLKPGAEVFLDGILVGNVKSVQFVPPQADGSKVAATLKIDESFKGGLREDSQVSIGTEGLLGNKIIQMASGKGNPIAAGGTLHGEETGIPKIIAGTDDIITNLNILSKTAVDISNSVERGEGTLGKLLKRTEIHDNLNEAVLEVRNLIKDIRTGPGTAGKLISDDTLYQRLTGTLERMDSMLAKIDHGEGTASKLLNDPSLYNKMDQMLARMDKITAGIDRGEGSLGKLIRDDSLYNDARSTMKRVDSLVATMESGDGTVGKLMKDPSLFNSMNQAASEVQKLLYDIKQNPKKFLTITLKIF